MSALSKHLENIGVDMNLLWSWIYDLIVKAVLCVDPHITNALKKFPNVKNNCFDLYGFDILIDETMKPWLLEVNLSPSLATDSPLDYTIKSNLLTDTLNLVGIWKFDWWRDNLTKMKNWFKSSLKASTMSKWS